MKFVLGWVFAFLAIPSVGYSATYYVSPDGNNTNTGTSETRPFLTIQKGLDMAVAGDTVLVKNGTYVNANHVWFKKSGVAGNPITLKNYPGHTPVIRFTGNFQVTIQALNYDSANGEIGYIVIEGFEITNGIPWGIGIYNGYNITITKNRIHDNKYSGIGSGGTNLLVDGNHIYNNGRANCALVPADCSHSHGMYMVGKNNVYTNNIITGNAGYGIQMAGFVDAKHVGLYSGCANTTIAHNTFGRQYSRGAIVVWLPGCTNVTIANNIFYDNAATFRYTQLDRESSGGGHVINNNLFYSSVAAGTVSNGLVLNGNGSFNTASGNVAQADPLFVDIGKGDFRLRPGSPAIDSGIAIGINKDFAGVARPQGKNYDIGAYELSSSSGDVAPPVPPRNVGIR